MTDEILQKEQMKRVANLLLDLLNPENSDHQKMADSGYILASQGRVSRAKLFGHKIVAVVQDVIPCQVNLHLKDPARSKCLCPGEGICRHVLAVFFHQYGQFFNVRNWLQRFSHGAVAGSRNASLLQENSADPIPYRDWIDLVDTFVTKELEDGEELYPFIVNKRIKTILDQLETVEPTDEKQAVYYRLSTRLHLLNHLLAHFLASPFTVDEFEDTCRITLMAIFHHLEGAIDGLSRIAADPDFLTAAQDAFRDLLFQDGPFKKEVQHLYWQWGSQVLKDHENWLEKELQHTETMVQRSDPDSLWAIARADLLFLNGDIEEAANILERAESYGFERLLLWFGYLAKQESWQRFQELIPFFFKQWPNYFRDRVELSASRIFQSLEPPFTAFYEATEARDIYEKFLHMMLPHSTNKTMYFYYKQGDYRRLVDFMRLQDKGVTALFPEQLRTILDKDPESLLPLLHHAVSVAIAEKNRDSYREAVYYLQRMKTIYERVQKRERWQYYFDTLLRMHQRLRAFQEECRKGQLFDG